MDTLAVATKNLTKSYGKLVAINKLTLSIPFGSISGILGPNGAGKTTLIKLLTGLLRPDRGEIWILGQELSRNPLEIKRRIGHVYANMGFYPWLSGEDNLMFFGMFYGFKREELRRRVADALDFTNLAKEKGKPVREYSLGMRQRLGIAKALLHSPEIIFMDEATSGVDVEGVNTIRHLMYALRAEGKTLIIASHRLDEIELVCDRIAILNEGTLIADGSPGEIRKSLRGMLFKYLVLVDRPLGALGLDAETWFLGNSNVVISGQDIKADLISRFGADVVQEVEPTLEEAFLWLVRPPARS